MLLRLRLRLVPLHYGLELLVEDGGRALVGPLGGEDEDLAGLLHVLLVHGAVAALAQHVAREGLRRLGRGPSAAAVGASGASRRHGGARRGA